MTAQAAGFALIGRSFSSDLFGGLYQVSQISRRAHRGGVWTAARPSPAQSAWLTTIRTPVMPTVVRL